MTTIYGYWRCSTDHQDQERQIFDVNKSVRSLIEVLDKKENLNPEQKDEA